MFKGFKKYEKEEEKEMQTPNNLDPTMKMYDVFKIFRERAENGGLKSVIDEYNLHNFSVSYNEETKAIRLSMDEGTFTIKFWNGKEKNEDYVFYREPDAPKGVGIGTHIGTMIDDGTFFKWEDRIDETELGSGGKYMEMFIDLMPQIQFARECDMKHGKPDEFHEMFISDHPIGTEYGNMEGRQMPTPYEIAMEL